MKNLNITLFAVLTIWASVLLGAEKPFTIVAEARQEQECTTTKLPDVAIGLLALGSPAKDLAASTTPNILTIKEPEVIVTPGQIVEVYLTVRTTAFSGNANLTIELIQNRTVMAKFMTGTVSLNSNSSHVIYLTDPTPLPTNILPGPIYLTAELSSGTIATSAVAKLFVR